MPGNIHVHFVRELGHVAAHRVNIEVKRMLTSQAHPRYAKRSVYKLGEPCYDSWDYGFEVSVWRTRQIKGNWLGKDLGMAWK